MAVAPYPLSIAVTTAALRLEVRGFTRTEFLCSSITSFISGLFLHERSDGWLASPSVLITYCVLTEGDCHAVRNEFVANCNASTAPNTPQNTRNTALNPLFRSQFADLILAQYACGYGTPYPWSPPPIRPWLQSLVSRQWPVTPASIPKSAGIVQLYFAIACAKILSRSPPGRRTAETC